MNKQFYTYVHIHTHIYRTFLSQKEDDKDKMQTYCRVRHFLHRPGQNDARGQQRGAETNLALSERPFLPHRNAGKE